MPILKKTGDFDEVEEIQNEIMNDYADDFSRHAPSNEIPKIRWIWDSVPVQLAKENNKFVFSHVKEGLFQDLPTKHISKFTCQMSVCFAQNQKYLSIR